LLEIAAALKAAGIQSVGVSFLHSFMNPSHEKRAAEILKAAVPGLYVSISCEVCPEIREYERTPTTVANA